MRLNRLEIAGFKSFPDRSELTFDQGVTAIVGPNGCGKSNVVDALTWVLGEQSAKSLRGGEMTDVIFNGSTSRRSLGLAEVTMTFDNRRRALATEAEEVQITRRVYRSGEGEYLSGVVEDHADLGHAEAAPAGGAVEDDVGHLAAAQAAGALLAQHPADGIDDVALARAVGPDDGSDARREVERRLVGERLEADHLEALEHDLSPE